MTKRYIFNFTSNTVNKPITYRLIRDYDIKINILKAEIIYGERGNLLVEIDAEDKNINDAFEYLKKCKVLYKPVNKYINFQQDKCVDCGSCTAVCFAGALQLDQINRNLIFNPDKCVVCGLCVKACPLSLFSINF